MDKPDYEPAQRVSKWLGEHEVREAIAKALAEIVEEHGGAAKAIAWDINSKLNNALSEMRS